MSTHLQAGPAAERLDRSGRPRDRPGPITCGLRTCDTLSPGGRMNEVKAGIPTGYATVTPVIYLRNAAAAIDYYRLAFGATEEKRVPGVNGTIAHAEIRIGDCLVVLVDELAGSGGQPSGTGALSPRIEFAIYCADADAMYERAIELGATVTLPISDVFWGDRYGKVMDPFGQVWALATRKVDLSIEEVVQRAGGGVAPSVR
jgi:PhnB protein